MLIIMVELNYRHSFHIFYIAFSFLQECFRFALPGIPHAVDLLKGREKSVKDTHTKLQAEGVIQPSQVSVLSFLTFLKSFSSIVNEMGLHVLNLKSRGSKRALD